jgi:dephospho-CoA kinase
MNKESANRNHLGLTGMMASGKGEVVKILENLGYNYISLSDFVREAAAATKRPVTRAEMQDIGNRLRKEGGPGILGRMVRDRIAESGAVKWVIDGIRNPYEVTELRELIPFSLIAVRSKKELIIARLKSRMRETDAADETELYQRLDREWGKDEPEGGQQVGKCVEISDHFIDNNGSLEELRLKVLKIVRLTEVTYEH